MSDDQRGTGTFSDTECVERNLSVCEGSDGHPWDPAVLQVSVSGGNQDLVEEVHV